MKNAVLEPTLEAYGAMEERKARNTRAGSITVRSKLPIPIPIPFLRGARFLIWKQDPSVGEPGLRVHFVPTYVLNGPKDSRINTDLPGTTPVQKNAQGDFIFPVNSPELDCAHTFAVVRDTLNLYQRARGGSPIPWAWNTGGNTEPLTAHPRAGVTANAYYSRGQRALKFFYFTPPGAPGHIYTCRSLDIVAHETGHAILDGLKPGWLSAGNPPQTGGLHEAFGDLTAIFLALSQLDQVEAAIALTKANLHDKNFLAALAEQFGSALGLPQGLRNADNDLKLSQVSNEVHAISQVFTGGIYDVLADIFAFEKQRQAAVKDPAQVLLEVGSHVCKLLIMAIETAPGTGATYAHVVNRMLVASHTLNDPPVYRTYIRNRFTFREVVVSPVPLTLMAQGMMPYDNPNFVEGEDKLELETQIHASDSAGQNRDSCCGTMQLSEFVMAEPKQLESRKTFTEEDILAGERAELVKAFR